MNAQAKRSLPFLLAALLLASYTQTLPAQTQSRWGWLSGAMKHNWGNIAAVAAVTAFIGYKFWQKFIKPAVGRNLADAIFDNNEEGIRYWLAKTTESNINSLSRVNNERTAPVFGALRTIVRLPYRITPLDAALQKNRTDLVRTLLSKGADPNKLRNAFNLRIVTTSQEYLELFLKHGLNPNTRFNAYRDF